MSRPVLTLPKRRRVVRWLELDAPRTATKPLLCSACHAVWHRDKDAPAEPPPGIKCAACGAVPIFEKTP